MQQNSKFQGQGDIMRNSNSYYQNENSDQGRAPGGGSQAREKVTINLEDAFMEEQKLYNILEVSR
jgi:hypothetical protein